MNIWSPFVYGTSVPVAPFNAVSLDGDQDNGAVTLIIRADGRVRWKVGTFITGKYHLYVRCLAYINFGNKAAGVIVGDNAVKYTLTSSCSVSVENGGGAKLGELINDSIIYYSLLNYHKVM